MTLGDWLRNYLYFPLGGSRQGLARTCLNLMVVMLIAGIWHGNNWGFLIWGTLHGAGLVVHRLTQVGGKTVPTLKAFWTTVPGIGLGWLLTQGLVFFSWLFFRLPEPDRFTLALQRLWGVPTDAQFTQKVYIESLGFSFGQLLLMLWGVLGLMGLTYLVRRGFKLELSWPVKLLLVPVFSVGPGVRSQEPGAGQTFSPGACTGWGWPWDRRASPAGPKDRAEDEAAADQRAE